MPPDVCKRSRAPACNYCSAEYDRERYEQIERIAAELLADGEPAATDRVLDLWAREEGYMTPKLDVRGAVFRGGAVLLVRERADGLWTLPGGWADVGETPSQAVTREIEQESGIRSRVISLAALLFDVDRLPPMSLGRSTPTQIARLREHSRRQPMAADFD